MKRTNAQRCKDYRKNNLEKCKKAEKLWRENNKEKRREILRKWRAKNKERLLSYKEKEKEWIKNNSDKVKKHNRTKYLKNKACPIKRITNNLRVRLWNCFKNGGKKNKKTEEMLGCSFAKAKKHLEKQFKDGMSWKNYGEWHIDHIYPLSRAKDEKHLEELFNYKNLQPLWAIENLIKSNRI